MPFAFLSLSLGNPTRGRQLFTPEKTTRDEGGCRKRENLTRKTTKRHWSSPYFKGAAVFFFFSYFSSGSSPFSALSLPLPIFLKGGLGHCRNAISTCIPISAAQSKEERSRRIHLRGPESGFLSARLIKIPGTKNAGCDVRRAGGVGLICMSGQLLHLQIGIH